MNHDVARERFSDLYEFLQSMAGVDTADIGVDLLLARKFDENGDDTEYEFKRIQVAPSIADELVALIQEKVENKHTALANDSLRFESYGIENRDRDESLLQYEDIENIPQFEYFERLLSGQRFEHTTYTESPKPEFQAIRIRDESNDKMAIAFLNYSRRQILGRTSRIRMTMGDETHTEVDESLMSIPDRVDSVYFDDAMYVFDQSKFEKVFDYLEEYERRADEVVATIQESDIPFRDFEMFREAVYGNNRVLRLMHKVHQRGAYEHMTPRDAEYIRENFETDVKFEKDEDGQSVLTMDDKRDVWAVLRFFNDDHLDSPITDEQYISLSKQDAG